MMDKQKKSRNTLGNSLYILGIIWKIKPSRVLLVFLEFTLNYGFWAFETVVFMRYLFGAEDSNRSFTDVAIFLGLTVLAWMFDRFFHSWMEERFRPMTDIDLHRGLNEMLFQKAVNVELGCYEDAEFYNIYTRASGEIFDRASAALDGTAQLATATAASLFVVAGMFSINVWIGAAALIPVAVNLITGVKAGTIEYQRDMDYVPHTRRQAYVSRAVYLQKYTKDIRLTGIFEVLKRIYDQAMEGHIAASKKHGLKITAFHGIRTFFLFPVAFQGIWILSSFFAMVTKTISAGDFVVAANSAVSTTWMLFGVTEGLVAVFNNALYIDNLKVFLNYKERIPENQPGLNTPERVDTLELREVSFKYKEGRDYVLKDINMTLEKGQIVSLVGHNGSGKSTLVKLILRFYDPTEGQILLNGVDIREYDLRQYRSLIGTTFQDYQIFSASVRDNVIMGNDIDREPDAVARDALEKSGVYDQIAELPLGIDTTLTREFDDNGAVLSGGGEQKIAIARSFAKRGSILLLDEPSSALDPIAEYRMFQNFVDLCRGDGVREKISVFISHRMSSSAVADEIFLMDGGRIIEQGDHRKLMTLDGKYAEMFSRQAENYRLGVEGA